MKGNLLIMHGGAPTAVINASLYGVIEEAKKNSKIDRILASDGGTGGFLAGKVLDLTDIPQEKLDLLCQTPGSAIGTSRDSLKAEDYTLMAEKLEQLGIAFVLMTGGNGTMDTCKKLSDACLGRNIFVCGIPKTMDNDLSKTDHSPGFASAARYLAGSVREVAQDVKGLAIHVVVIEAFGRDAGWLAASSVLARENPGDAPHMILCPETAFDEEAFLARVQALYEEKHGVVVVASEGLRYKDGSPIVKPIFSVGRATYFGDV
ncbi:MAG TPA: diphosphate--fructose-6-phosphate 1-phosphotransferase, partial [Sphaerochaeta sp.]|nr:diphosphate--fructose-6-phosphate 1-phosphotransferase [Sphaerochaeta sp.]